MQEIRKAKRQLESIPEPEKIQQILTKFLNNQTMFVRGYDPPYAVKIAGFDENNTISMDMGQFEPEPGQRLIVFRILGRYMHLECEAIQPTGQGALWTVQVHQAAIARSERGAPRMPVNEGEVYITNIRASKHAIDATLFNIPTSVKVNFGAFEQELKSKHDFVEILTFGKRGTIFDKMRKENLPLLVRDTREPESYEPPAEDYLDYKEWAEDNLRTVIEDYRRKKIISEAAVPVIYITHDLQSIPLGYIRVMSRTRRYDFDDVTELREKAFQLVDRIRDSNTVFIQEKQQLINISRGGLKAVVDNEELKQYLQRQSGFTFDVVFKMQAPITLYGMIRSAYMQKDTQDLIIALQISGNSSREGEMKRFLDNISKMEARFKNAIQEKRAAAQKKG